VRLRNWIYQTKIFQADERMLLGAILAAFFFQISESGANAAKVEKAEAPKETSLANEKRCRWSEHESRLTSFASKIRSLENEISDLIDHKKSIDNPEKVSLITQQISFKHKDLAKVVRDYEEERLHVRFQHPDREREEDRQYKAVRLKSLSEIEEAFGLDGRLDRIRQQVRVVFPVKTAEPASQVRAPASSIEEEDIPERIHLVK
jgi:hypothetical protein